MERINRERRICCIRAHTVSSLPQAARAAFFPSSHLALNPFRCSSLRPFLLLTFPSADLSFCCQRAASPPFLLTSLCCPRELPTCCQRQHPVLLTCSPLGFQAAKRAASPFLFLS
ncbi:hypothetical protein ACFXTN_025589 [Malus domestica]